VTFERCEIPNHLKESDAELRRYPDVASERLRFRTRNSEEVRDSLAELKLRLFAWILRQRSSDPIPSSRRARSSCAFPDDGTENLPSLSKHAVRAAAAKFARRRRLDQVACETTAQRVSSFR
jgi:hypothetical protein